MKARIDNIADKAVCVLVLALFIGAWCVFVYPVLFGNSAQAQSPKSAANQVGRYQMQVNNGAVLVLDTTNGDIHAFTTKPVKATWASGYKEFAFDAQSPPAAK